MFAIIEDMLLRWVWTFTISVGEGGFDVLDETWFKTILGILEIAR